MAWLLIAASTLVSSPVLAQPDLTTVPTSDLFASGTLFTSNGDEPSPVDVGPAFAELFRAVAGDFKRFSNQENALWLVAAGGASGLVHRADRDLTATLTASRAIRRSLEPGKVIGSTSVQVGSAFATLGLGFVTHSPAVTDLGVDLVRAQLLTQGLTQGIKFVAGRRRPDGTTRSFPSGHTAAAFATGTVLHRHFGWKVGAPAYGVAAYVAASRLSENRHYLSDLVFGATLGILAGRQVTVGKGRARFVVVPMAAANGLGISFAHIGH